MPTDAERRELFQAAETDWGERPATTLMDSLVLDPSDVARRSDIAELLAEIRISRAEHQGEIAAVRGEIAEVRGEVAALRSETKSEISALRSETRGELANVRGEIALVHGEIALVHGEIAEVRGEAKGLYGRLVMLSLLNSFAAGGFVLAAVNLG